MAGSKFNIYITAFDKASGVINKINRTLANTNQPVAKFGRAVKDFSKESGISGLLGNLERTAKAADQVASRVSSIIAPMATVFGIGSVAAVSSLADAWGKLGREITQTAQYTALSTSEIQKWQGAALSMGIATSATNQQLVGFGQNLEDSLFGRNQEMLALMNQLQVKIGTIGSGVRDESEVLKDFADRVQELSSRNPFAARKAIDLAGLSAMAPLLMKGRKGIEELMEVQRRYGYEQDEFAIKRANDYRTSVLRLSTSLAGLRNYIGDKLVPVFQPLIDKFAIWTRQNREVIGLRIQEVFQGLATAIMSVDWGNVLQGISDFVGDLNEAVKSTIGWKNALILLGVALNAGWILNVFKLAKGIFLVGFFALRAIPGLVLLIGTFARLAIAFLLTPFGMIVAGCAALGVAAYELYKHWDAFVSWWKKIWDDIVGIADKAGKKLYNVLPLPLRAAMSSGTLVYKILNREKSEQQAQTEPKRLGTSIGTATSGMTMPGPYAAPRQTLPPPNTSDWFNDDATDDNGKVKVDVVFHNAPKGANVSMTQSGKVRATARTQRSLSSAMTP